MSATGQSATENRARIRPVWGLAAAGGLVGCGSVASAVLGGRPEAADWMARVWPFLVLALSVAVIVLLISVARLHAFFALILSAIAAGFMSRPGILPGEPSLSHWVAAVEQTGIAFGVMAGKIGLVIALASVIGMCLLESGAADRIVRRFIDIFGPRHAGLALLLGTYVVSIPIFFDTVFLLLVPLARALRMRTGRDYMLYLMAICAAAAVTHTMVIPHPGPAAAADTLRVDAGLSILVGLVTGLVPLACAWAFCRWLNRRMNIVPAEMPGVSAEDLRVLNDTPAERLPSLRAALLPIVLPLALIWLASAAELAGEHCPAVVRTWTAFMGNRNVALLLGTGLAAGVLMRQRGLGLGAIAGRMGPAVEIAGLIILITSAGGAFGAMLAQAGIGRAIEAAVAGGSVNVVFLSWLVAMVIRVAQGSVTTAMITAAAIMAPLAGPGLSVHPIYVFMAVGYGALFVSWMNDSGFWVISRVGGLTERETLTSWTAMTAVLSVTGLIMTVILSLLFPLTGGK